MIEQCYNKNNVLIKNPSKTCATFGDLADIFIKLVEQIGKGFSRVDIVFDHYRTASVKSLTRQKRSNTSQPIRRSIENRNVPLPKNWANFLAVWENKSDLAAFLSFQLIAHNFSQFDIVTAGGFESERKVASTNQSILLTQLEASHEEADTRLILHAVNSSAKKLFVLCRDTDVLLLLIYHFEKIKCNELWMIAGTSHSRKYIPIHTIYQKLAAPLRSNLLAFHAVTGCDVTSFFSGVTKKRAWNTYIKYPDLLGGLGKIPLTTSALECAEKFVVKLYNIDADSANEARCILFGKLKQPEQMPPTSDALYLHLKRAHYQAFIWESAHLPEVSISPTDNGWKVDNGIVLIS